MEAVRDAHAEPGDACEHGGRGRHDGEPGDDDHESDSAHDHEEADANERPRADANDSAFLDPRAGRPRECRGGERDPAEQEARVPGVRDRERDVRVGAEERERCEPAQGDGGGQPGATRRFRAGRATKKGADDEADHDEHGSRDRRARRGSGEDESGADDERQRG